MSREELQLACEKKQHPNMKGMSKKQLLQSFSDKPSSVFFPKHILQH